MKQKDLRGVKILCICLLPLLLFSPAPTQRVIHATCERVIDGDTVEVEYGNKLLKLRLAYIDAPEIKQLAFDKAPIGVESKDFLEALALGKKIKIKVIQKDRYGRYLAQIFSSGIDLNLLMVEKGHAMIYRYYDFDSVKQKIRYMSAEMVAKRTRSGMWATFGFHDPYAHRRLKKARINNAKH